TVPIGGVSAPGVLKRTLQTVDDATHVARFVWTLSVDQDAFTRASQDLINEEIESLRRKIGDIPPARLAELTTAEVTYSGEWRVSLDDGEAVLVEEIIVSRVGPIFTRVASRVTRPSQSRRSSLARPRLRCYRKACRLYVSRVMMMPRWRLDW